MLFTKLSEVNKQLVNNYKEQYGNENVLSYRALLMRGTSHDDAINLINSRKELKPAVPIQPASAEKPKRQTKKAKVEAVELLAIENTKEPAPAPKAKGGRKKKNEENTVSLVV